MLTRKQIIRQMEFSAQYGPPEDSFSPDWHAKNPGPGPDALPAIREGERTIVVKIRRILLKSGDVTLDNTLAEGWTLPEGAVILED